MPIHRVSRTDPLPFEVTHPTVYKPLTPSVGPVIITVNLNILSPSLLEWAYGREGNPYIVPLPRMALSGPPNDYLGILFPIPQNKFAPRFLSHKIGNPNPIPPSVPPNGYYSPFPLPANEIPRIIQTLHQLLAIFFKNVIFCFTTIYPCWRTLGLQKASSSVKPMDCTTISRSFINSSFFINTIFYPLINPGIKRRPVSQSQLLKGPSVWKPIMPIFP